ncbi:CPBP family intramembrane glutamic endopeptidase [Spongiimicrobium salis]|uniref:CPBP family intramembrane glutamic endopeptidase n=1 Tax=Spongiimicrobium salis TaxID=1667022 RepID=UPI00374D6A81
MDRTKISFQQKIADTLRNNSVFTILSIFLLVGLGVLGQIGFLLSIVLIATLYYLQKTTWEKIGLGRPKSWLKTIGLGVLLTWGILACFHWFLTPMLLEWFPMATKDISRFDTLRGNEWLLIAAIVSSWITAGFAEELIWRGYILKHTALLLGNTSFSWGFSLVLSALAFGALHFYQGPLGMLQTGLVGMILGIIYICNGKKNLWLNILIHGLIDTISMIGLYLGSI